MMTLAWVSRARLLLSKVLTCAGLSSHTQTIAITESHELV